MPPGAGSAPPRVAGRAGGRAGWSWDRTAHVGRHRPYGELMAIAQVVANPRSLRVRLPLLGWPMSDPGEEGTAATHDSTMECPLRDAGRDRHLRLPMDTLPLTGEYTTFAVQQGTTDVPDDVTDSAASGTGWAKGPQDLQQRLLGPPGTRRHGAPVHR